MNGLLTETFMAALLSGAVVAAVPLILAGLGEQMSERSGVLNIGLEGMLLGGAYAGFAAAVGGWGIWGGFAAGMAAGMALALIMVVFCVRLGINQIIVGIAITLGVTGVTALLHNHYFARTYPRLPAPQKWAIPGLSDLPLLGPGLFHHHLMTYLALLAPVVLMVIYKQSFLGLNLSAAGEKPEALDAAGIDVTRTRTTGVLFAGAMAGLGGAYLSEIGSGIFVPGMSHGSGFIAIVLAMLARHRPLWVMGGALLFGLCLSAATALQVGGVDIPTDFIQMLPFAMVMAVLIAFGRKARLPAALGAPYRRGQR